jgi:hypothetical protein
MCTAVISDRVWCQALLEPGLWQWAMAMYSSHEYTHVHRRAHLWDV